MKIGTLSSLLLPFVLATSVKALEFGPIKAMPAAPEHLNPIKIIPSPSIYKNLCESRKGDDNRICFNSHDGFVDAASARASGPSFIGQSADPANFFVSLGPAETVKFETQTWNVTVTMESPDGGCTNYWMTSKLTYMAGPTGLFCKENDPVSIPARLPSLLVSKDFPRLKKL